MTQAIAERDLQLQKGPVPGEDVPSKTLFIGGITDKILSMDESWIHQYFPESFAHINFRGFHFISLSLHFISISCLAHVTAKAHSPLQRIPLDGKISPKRSSHLGHATS